MKHCPRALKFAFAITAASVLLAAPAFAKECYAPDARAQERAFSRAVSTEGGRVLWLGGQTGGPHATHAAPHGRAAICLGYTRGRARMTQTPCGAVSG